MISTEYLTTIIDMHILCLTLYQLSKYFLYTIDNTLNIWKIIDMGVDGIQSIFTYKVAFLFLESEVYTFDGECIINKNLPEDCNIN